VEVDTRLAAFWQRPRSWTRTGRRSGAGKPSSVGGRALRKRQNRNKIENFRRLLERQQARTDQLRVSRNPGGDGRNGPCPLGAGERGNDWARPVIT
jgi:hypothetical protein